MRVRVYRNLNKGGISIQSKVEGKWKVTDYSFYVVLKNCTFKVQEGGRQRVLSKKQKNVHAWVEGDLVSTSKSEYLQVNYPEPYYDPYKMDHFTVNDEKVETYHELKLFCPPREKKTKKAKLQKALPLLFFPSISLALAS